jgi:hypothetical protein
LIWSHTKREERREREEKRERKWRREKRRERRQILVCVTKPKFLVLVHTRFSLIDELFLIKAKSISKERNIWLI